MKTLKSTIQHTDYGIDRRVVKYGNKILGYMEPFPTNTACDEEKGKWFYVLGKPSDPYPTIYRCDNEEEARKALYETTEAIVNEGGTKDEDTNNADRA